MTSMEGDDNTQPESNNVQTRSPSQVRSRFQWPNGGGSISWDAHTHWHFATRMQSRPGFGLAGGLNTCIEQPTADGRGLDKGGATGAGRVEAQSVGCNRSLRRSSTTNASGYMGMAHSSSAAHPYDDGPDCSEPARRLADTAAKLAHWPQRRDKVASQCAVMAFSAETGPKDTLKIGLSRDNSKGSPDVPKPSLTSAASASDVHRIPQHAPVVIKSPSYEGLRTIQPQLTPRPDVFLGGACGGTTWRQRTAMPLLDSLGISYFNPQKDVWTEDLIELEEDAKQRSRMLLFVIDAATSNAATFIEVAYLAAQDAPVVVVFSNELEWLAAGTSPGEAAERARMAAELWAISAHHRIPCFRSLAEGLDHVCNVMVAQRSWRDALAKPNVRRKYLRLHLERQWFRARAAAGKITARGILAAARDAFYMAESALVPQSVQELARSALLAFELCLVACACLAWPRVPIGAALSGLVLVHLLACLLVAVTRSRRSPSPRTRRLNSVPSRRVTGRNRHSVSTPISPPPSLRRGFQFAATDIRRNSKRTYALAHYDVFMASAGGHADFDWIAQRAVPLLDMQGLSYTDASLLGTDTWEVRMNMVTASSILLFHTPSSDSLLSGLTQLAYYIGARAAPVAACVPAECLRPSHCANTRCGTCHSLAAGCGDLRRVHSRSVDPRGEPCDGDLLLGEMESYDQRMSIAVTLGTGALAERRPSRSTGCSVSLERRRTLERAYAYLRDIACRNDVVLFERLSDALVHVVNVIKTADIIGRPFSGAGGQGGNQSPVVGGRRQVLARGLGTQRSRLML